MVDSLIRVARRVSRYQVQRHRRLLDIYEDEEDWTPITA